MGSMFDKGDQVIRNSNAPYSHLVTPGGIYEVESCSYSEVYLVGIGSGVGSSLNPDHFRRTGHLAPPEPSKPRHEPGDVVGAFQPVPVTLRPPPPAPDKVDPAIQPSHYTQFGGLEPLRIGVERLVALGKSFGLTDEQAHQLGRAPILLKIDKYVARAPFKNKAQDLAKAARCLEMLTKFDAGDADWWKST